MHPFRHTDVVYAWEVGKLTKHCVNGSDSQPFSHLELYSRVQIASFMIPKLHNLWAAVEYSEMALRRKKWNQNLDMGPATERPGNSIS